MSARWSKAEAWRWYEERPWITGCNFIPSGAPHGALWLLQEHGHESAYRDAAREIAFASWIGLNSIRFYLPFEVWKYQREAFFAHLDELLALLGRYGMTMVPVLFNDCTVPKGRWREARLGAQPAPVPGFFGGASGGAFDDDVQGGENIGYLPFDEPGSAVVMREFVDSLASRYGQDERILMWNVWNEIGNSNRGALSLEMMRSAFSWLREAGVAQPLTAEVWGGGAGAPLDWVHNPTALPEVEHRAMELSDIVTFHYYGDYLHAKQLVGYLRRFERPLVNTEWMHRPYGSLIETHLPLWKREGIGSYFFGLVNGQPQFHNVWEFIKGLPNIDTTLWMHDVVHSDFTPYDPDEIEVLRSCNLGLGAR
ncbi:hypothetical protein [Tessaracoccus defluvii]|uniref:Cellulase family glycosylhydrolase n=1 Tax=Tessaracoccus defluvii TaxID=1285901 RepID=A0A7H0H692_9ACTN|nr:hypothetical protein [Tessaracoccus defluvii]QNP56058.1 hypothetical protein H9L22_00530 [Tessaracoccus defluvii]